MNRFADASNIEQFLNYVVDAGSMCWSLQDDGERIFDDVAANKIVTEAKEALGRMGYVSVMEKSDLPIVQAEVRIIYGIDSDGAQCTSTTFTADGLAGHIPDYFTGLIMFETGKINFLQRCGIVNQLPDQ